MWKPILCNNSKAEAKIHEIANVLIEKSNLEKTPGFFSGLTGVAVFFAYYDKYCGNQKHNSLIEELIEKAFAEIEANWVSSSFCTGLSGIFWAVEHIQENFEVNLYNNFEELHEVLKKEMNLHAGNNYFDYLHGANGIFYYLMKHSKSLDYAVLDNHVQTLSQFAIVNENQVKWESYIDPDSPRKVYNLSLSHGISSTIIFLCQFLNKFPNHQEAKKLRNGAIDFLLNSKNPPNGDFKSLYPGTTTDTNRFGNSRLGWCYGDISHALALFAAGKYTGVQNYTAEALNIMDFASSRKDTDLDSIRDAPFCHGTSGLAHIFNRFYQSTNNLLYKETALYWYNKTLEMDVFEDGFGGYKMFTQDRGWVNSISLLEGTAGIGLTLLAAVSKNTPLWDSALLLDF